MKSFIVGIGLFSFLLCSSPFAQASVGHIDSTFKYGWGENIGWINFGTSEGAVTVEDNYLTGYAWGENIGWISLNCSNTSSCATVDYKVANTTSGVLSGYAWAENVGWINFSPGFGANPTILSNGDFSGYAWGENIGWISFNCSNTSTCATVDFKVRTDWRPPSGGGGGNPTPTPTLTPTPVSSATPSTTPSATPTTTPTFTRTVSPTIPPHTPTPTTTSRFSPTPFPTVTPTEPPPSVTPSISPPVSPPPGVTPSSGPPIDGKNPTDTILKTTGTIAKKVAAPGSIAVTLGTAIAAITSFASAASAAGNFFNVLDFILKNILIFFGIKKRARAWGTVYNAATKEPLPFTKIQLIGKDMRVLETRITDREGRYGFLSNGEGLAPGELFTFAMLPARTDFAFPSKRVTGQSDTVLYPQVYNGGMAQAQPGQLIKFDIPMDPLKPELAGGIIKLPKVHLHNFLVTLSHACFIVGLVLVPLNYIFHPTKLNLFMLILFVGINSLVILGDMRQRSYGVVVDRTNGGAMPYSLITLSDKTQQRKGFTVSDNQGRYYLLSDKGMYDIAVFTPANVNPPRSIKEPITAGRGWVAKKIQL